MQCFKLFGLLHHLGRYIYRLKYKFRLEGFSSSVSISLCSIRDRGGEPLLEMRTLLSMELDDLFKGVRGHVPMSMYTPAYARVRVPGMKCMCTHVYVHACTCTRSHSTCSTRRVPVHVSVSVHKHVDFEGGGGGGIKLVSESAAKVRDDDAHCGPQGLFLLPPYFILIS